MRCQDPAIGEVRVVRRFALLPIETKSGICAWLEWVNIKQRYTENGWINMCFVEKDQKPGRC